MRTNVCMATPTMAKPPPTKKASNTRGILISQIILMLAVSVRTVFVENSLLPITWMTSLTEIAVLPSMIPAAMEIAVSTNRAIKESEGDRTYCTT